VRRQVFIGHDPRQPLSYNVMRYSIERHASRPIPITGLMLNQLPITRQGATEFTYSRFLAPYLSDYEGFSMFADEDMVVTGDIHELFDYVENDKKHDVWVMRNQERYEWASMMVFNNSRLRHLTPDHVQDTDHALFDFKWAESVGSVPDEWNHCVAVHEPKEAKLYHWTQGIPFWQECRGCPEDKNWFQEYEAMVKSVKWIDLHRNTKHFKPVIERMLKRYGVKMALTQAQH
jgi:hypothetical protein